MSGHVSFSRYQSDSRVESLESICDLYGYKFVYASGPASALWQKHFTDCSCCHKSAI